MRNMNHSLITAYPGLKRAAPRYQRAREGLLGSDGLEEPPAFRHRASAAPSTAQDGDAGAPEPQGPCTEEEVTSSVR